MHFLCYYDSIEVEAEQEDDGDRVSEHANICADVYYSSILKLSSFRIIRAGSHLRKN